MSLEVEHKEAENKNLGSGTRKLIGYQENWNSPVLLYKLLSTHLRVSNRIKTRIMFQSEGQRASKELLLPDFRMKGLAASSQSVTMKERRCPVAIIRGDQNVCSTAGSKG